MAMYTPTYLTIVIMAIVVVQVRAVSYRYEVGTVQRNWADASSDCQTQGGILAKILNKNTQDTLEYLITAAGLSDNAVWFGLADEETQFYPDNCPQSSYTNWNSREPNSADERCVHLLPRSKGFTWNDLPCSYEIYYVCQYDDIPIVPRRPVVFWPLNTEYNLTDASGNGNDVILRGSVTAAQADAIESYFLPGQSDSFLKFPINDESILSFSVTIMLEVYAKSSSGSILNYGNNHGCSIFQESSNTVTASVVSYSGIRYSMSMTSLTSNDWNSLAISYDYDSGELKLWHDGGLVDCLNIGQTELNTTDALYISYNASAEGAAFQGYVTCLQVYDQALSQSEMQRVHSRCPVPSEPVDHWDLSGSCGFTTPSDECVQIDSCTDDKILSNLNGNDGVLYSAASLTDSPIAPYPSCAINLQKNFINFGNYSGTCVSDIGLCPLGITVSMWMRISVTESDCNGYILSSGGDTDQMRGVTIWLGRNSSGSCQLFFDVRNGLKKWRAGVNLPYDDHWFFSVFTFKEENDVKIYANGDQIAHDTLKQISIVHGDSSSLLVLGAKNDDLADDKHYISGSFSDLKIYFSELSAEMISSKYAAYTNRNYFGPKLWHDGARCGILYPMPSGKPSICNPDGDNGHCCSFYDWCGVGASYCSCTSCTDYRSLFGSCSPGWRSNGGSCYHFSSHLKTWQDAKDACQLIGGYLVTIETVSEQNFLEEQSMLRAESCLSPSNCNLWIGLQSANSGHRWISGNEAEYTEWAQGQPLTPPECVSISAADGKWYTENCENLAWYSCEMNDTLPTPKPVPTKSVLVDVAEDLADFIPFVSSSPAHSSNSEIMLIDVAKGLQNITGRLAKLDLSVNETIAMVGEITVFVDQIMSVVLHDAVKNESMLPNVTASSVEEKRQVTNTLLSTMDTLSGMMSDALEPGDEAVIQHLPTLSVYFEATSADNFEKTSAAFESSFGVKLPAMTDLLPEQNLNDSIFLTSFRTKGNLFTWGENSHTVGSDIMTLYFEDSDGDKIDVDGITTYISLSLNNPPIEFLDEATLLPTIYEDTGQSRYSWSLEAVDTFMAFQMKLNVSDISLNNSVRVYMSYNNTPTWNSFDFHANITATEGVLNIFIPNTEVEEAGNYVFSLFLPTVNMFNLTMSVTQHGCRYWDEDNEIWKRDGCMVSSESNTNTTVCLCNHLTSFGAAFYVVPPNPIDFDTVLDKFAHLDSNPSVFSTVIVIFALYLLIVIWARRKDRREKVVFNGLPLPSNGPNDRYAYEVSIMTGRERGSGTTSDVYIKLYGTASRTRATRIHSTCSDCQLFQRGSMHTFLLTSLSFLGDIKYLHVRHDNSGQGKNASWFLSEIIIKDLKTQKRYDFPCFRWLSRDHGDGKTQRVLTPWDGKGPKPGETLIGKAKGDLTDEHLWVSVIAKPYGTHFTRVQRVSCCLMLLLTSMVVSCMWYRSDYDDTKIKTIRLGPLTFTWHQIFVGIMSGLLVAPINFFVVELFRRSTKRRNSGRRSNVTMCQKLRHLFKKSPDKEHQSYQDEGIYISSTVSSEYSVLETATDKYYRSSQRERHVIEVGRVREDRFVNTQAKCQTMVAKEKKEKTPRKMSVFDKELTLPYPFIYVAWFLVFSVSIVSAFFTILYSMQWGNDKSIAFLKSLSVSLVEDILILQPVKVIGFAVILVLVSSIRRRNLRDLEEMDDVKAMAPAGVYSSDDETTRSLENDREEIEKTAVIGGAVKEIVLYFLFVSCLLIIVYNDRDINSYNMRTSLENLYFKNDIFKRITRGTTIFWEWIFDFLLPSIYPAHLYNGMPLPNELSALTADLTSFRVSPPRLLQYRVRPDLCKSPPIFNGSVACNVEYSGSSADRGVYDVGWLAVNTTEQISELSPWAYAGDIPSVLTGYDTIFSQYGDGGYTVHLGEAFGDSVSAIQSLWTHLWLDRSTRAIVIDWLVYCANLNLYGLIVVPFEFPTTGGIWVKPRVEIFRFDDYVGSYWIFLATLQLVFLGFLVYYIIKKVKMIYRERLKHFSSFWNWIETIKISLCLSGVGIYTYRFFKMRSVSDEVTKLGSVNMVQLSHLLDINQSYRRVVGLAVFIAMIQFLDLFKFHHRMSMLTATILRSATNLVHFAIFFAITLFAHAALIYASIGLTSLICSDILELLYKLLTLWLDNKNYADFVLTDHPVLGALFFFSFFISMYTLAINVFVSVIITSFTEAEESMPEKTSEYALLQLTWSYVKRLLGFGSDTEDVATDRRGKDQNVDSDMVYCDHLEDIDIKLDRILELAKSL
ncbi:polycystin-1-like protein 2 isoform X1 [Ptychodera flava]|uniref:polycystin-1-like protein 2 isoform X1 n=1 Tax=Ptychodera flava TaxID=63121 RepID=UPI003969C997